MNFLTPLAFLGGLIAIPIVLLYMLRLRRREIMISSTYLWNQVMADTEANTPWQRLKRNLLLLLQLIILLLLVITLARPFVSVPAVSAGQTALLLDASASMNATDVDDGTRFDEARREALAMIDTLGADQEMTIIRVADVPEVLVPYTDDRAQLRAAVNDADSSHVQADWNAALNLAAAGSSTREDFTIVIVSDGGLGVTEGIPGIAGELRYVSVGTSGDNVAISALATRALPGQPPQLFSQITNTNPIDAEVVYSLRVDGELVFTDFYTVPANGERSIVSTEALGEDFQSLEASVTLSVNSDAHDYLAEDNVAYAVFGRPTQRSVLVMSDGNLYLEEVLQSMPGVEAVRSTPATGIPERPYDLYILDGWLPTTLPNADLLIINPPSSTPLFTLGGENEDTANPIVTQGDARVAFVDFADVNVLRFRNIENAAWAESLITAAGGPLLLAGEVDGRQVGILPFDLIESDLPLNIAWPVLISNLLDWYTPRNALVTTDGLTVGQSLDISPPFEADRVRVVRPDGESRDLIVDRQTLIFADTESPGLYTIEAYQGDELLQQQMFAVNLFSPLESDLTPVTQGALLVGQATVAAPEEEELGQRELWQYVAGAALVVLLVEWWLYHRRNRPPIFKPVPTTTARRRRIS